MQKPVTPRTPDLFYDNKGNLRSVYTNQIVDYKPKTMMSAKEKRMSGPDEQIHNIVYYPDHVGHSQHSTYFIIFFFLLIIGGLVGFFVWWNRDKTVVCDYDFQCKDTEVCVNGTCVTDNKPKTCSPSCPKNLVCDDISGTCKHLPCKNDKACASLDASLVCIDQICTNKPISQVVTDNVNGVTIGLVLAVVVCIIVWLLCVIFNQYRNTIANFIWYLSTICFVASIACFGVYASKANASVTGVVQDIEAGTNTSIQKYVLPAGIGLFVVSIALWFISTKLTYNVQPSIDKIKKLEENFQKELLKKEREIRKEKNKEKLEKMVKNLEDAKKAHEDGRINTALRYLKNEEVKDLPSLSWFGWAKNKVWDQKTEEQRLEDRDDEAVKQDNQDRVSVKTFDLQTSKKLGDWFYRHFTFQAIPKESTDNATEVAGTRSQNMERLKEFLQRAKEKAKNAVESTVERVESAVTEAEERVEAQQRERSERQLRRASTEASEPGLDRRMGEAMGAL